MSGPLERFFGIQRQRGGVHDNPNAAEFAKNTQALRVVNGVGTALRRGNCRGTTIDQPSLKAGNHNKENYASLPKRRRNALNTNTL